MQDDMPVPRTLFGAWAEMLQIRDKQREDPTYEFDTPLPKSASDGTDPAVANELSASIGDLAPAIFA